MAMPLVITIKKSNFLVKVQHLFRYLVLIYRSAGCVVLTTLQGIFFLQTCFHIVQDEGALEFKRSNTFIIYKTALEQSSTSTCFI